MGMLFTCEEAEAIISLGAEREESAAILNSPSLPALQRREQDLVVLPNAVLVGFTQTFESPGAREAEQMM